MGRTSQLPRWILGLSGAAVLLQAGSCTLGNSQLASQFLTPQISTIFSDIIFFFLDNALVRLTT